MPSISERTLPSGALIGSCPIRPSNHIGQSESVHRPANNLQFYNNTTAIVSVSLCVCTSLEKSDRCHVVIINDTPTSYKYLHPGTPPLVSHMHIQYRVYPNCIQHTQYYMWTLFYSCGFAKCICQKCCFLLGLVI